MRQAEIDGGDLGRIGRQVGQDVAAARGDGHDMAIAVERQRLEIDLRVFPDLRVDQAAEQPLEQAFEKAFRDNARWRRTACFRRTRLSPRGSATLGISGNSSIRYI